MKILYGVHQFMPDFVGGTEQDTWEVATRMRDRGHDISIVTRAPGAAGAETTSRGGIPVTRLSVGAMTPTSLFASTFGHRQLTRGFRRTFNEIRPDLVHFQHLRGLPAGLVGWIKAQGCPVLISLRDFWFICPNAQLIDYVTEELCTTPGEPVHCARCAMVRAGLRPALFAAPALAPGMAARNRVLAGVMQQADVLLVYSEFVRAW
ncbi:MAG: glycosyltransferase, partial [Anaerolineae bacterium]|nr:glycosyltransferase [Anaerolineae bacterium]